MYLLQSVMTIGPRVSRHPTRYGLAWDHTHKKHTAPLLVLTDVPLTREKSSGPVTLSMLPREWLIRTMFQPLQKVILPYTGSNIDQLRCCISDIVILFLQIAYQIRVYGLSCFFKLHGILLQLLIVCKDFIWYLGDEKVQTCARPSIFCDQQHEQ